MTMQVIITRFLTAMLTMMTIARGLLALTRETTLRPFMAAMNIIWPGATYTDQLERFYVPIPVPKMHAD
jgi:hypothetical protein